MIIKKVIAGGWHGYALPNGSYAVALRGQGRIECRDFTLPAPELLYVVCNNGPLGLQIAGQEHFGTRNREWDGNSWTDVGPSFGVYPVIYKGQDLVQVPVGASHQGYRFVSDSGELVTGDQSMFDPVSQIHEYTDTGGFRIGQGHDSRCHVLGTDNVVRVLEEGECTFIRTTRDWDNFAVTIVKLKEGKTVIYWLTRDDLLQLPIFSPAVGLPKVERKLWAGWFEFSPNYKAPRNCVVAVRNISSNATEPTIITDETAGMTGQILGKFISGDTVADVSRKAYDAVQRPIVYWDARVWPELPDTPEGSWVCLQAYCLKDETPAEFEANIRRIVADTLQRTRNGQSLALVCQQYTSNLTQTTDLKSLIPVYLRLARDYPQIVALLMFSDSGRATGLQDHPELIDYWKEAMRSIQTPDIVPYNKEESEEPEKPEEEEPTEPMPKNKDQVRADIDELIRFYNEPDGLNRAARGIPSPIIFNDRAITDWFTLAVMFPVEEVKRQIRRFPEYQEQHPSDPQ